MKRLLLLSFTLLLSGCYLKSVHPLVTSDQSQFIEGLDGVYETEEQRWTFTSDPEQVANLLQYFEDEEVEFEPDEGDSIDFGFDGYFVLFENLEAESSSPTLMVGKTDSIAGNIYLDLKIFDTSSSSFRDSHLLRVHTFSKISLTEDELMLEFFKSKWLKTEIKENRVRIKHELVSDDFDEDEVLITAGNKELRQFVERYGSNEEAYDDQIKLVRK